jgi:hypothetical protein
MGGINWNQLTTKEFLTIPPNPRYNKLERPLILEIDHFQYMHDKALEFIGFYVDYRDHEIKPWDVRGEYRSEDINAMNMLRKMESDVQEMNKRKQEAEQKTKQYIRENY